MSSEQPKRTRDTDLLRKYQLLSVVKEGGMPMAKYAGFTLPVSLPMIWPFIYNFEFREDDIILNSSPKSGTHWLHYVLALLVTENFGELPLEHQFPILELPLWKERIAEWAAMKSRRLLLSHLPGPLLPKNAFKGKFIYIYRDPRDVVVSDYYHYLNDSRIWPFSSSFAEFVDMFIRGDTHWGPYPEHLKAILKLKNEGKPILFIRFEDLKTKYRDTIKRVAKFIDVDADEELVDKIVQATKPAVMKNNKSANGHIWQSLGVWEEGSSIIRKGESGGWKAEFTDELAAKFERFLKENIPKEFVNHELI